MTDEYPIVSYIVDISSPEDPDKLSSHGILEIHTGFTFEELDSIRNKIFVLLVLNLKKNFLNKNGISLWLIMSMIV